MIRGEDEPQATEATRSEPATFSPTAPLRAAALAAGMLEEAWTDAGMDALRAEVVRGLARELRQEIESLTGLASGNFSTEATVDGALRAADVANLAASSLAELPDKAASEAVAAAYLASGAARALVTLAEVFCAEALEGEHAKHALKDVRSAHWRARFAVRQTDEYAGVEG